MTFLTAISYVRSVVNETYDAETETIPRRSKNASRDGLETETFETETIQHCISAFL